MQFAVKRINYKVIFILLFSVIISLFLSIQNVDAAVAKIGLINLAEVLNSHPYSEQINQLNATLREELQKRQGELNKQGKGLDES